MPNEPGVSGTGAVHATCWLAGAALGLPGAALAAGKFATGMPANVDSFDIEGIRLGMEFGEALVIARQRGYVCKPKDMEVTFEYRVKAEIASRTRSSAPPREVTPASYDCASNAGKTLFISALAKKVGSPVSYISLRFDGERFSIVDVREAAFAKYGRPSAQYPFEAVEEVNWLQWCPTAGIFNCRGGKGRWRVFHLAFGWYSGKGPKPDIVLEADRSMVFRNEVDAEVMAEVDRRSPRSSSRPVF